MGSRQRRGPLEGRLGRVEENEEQINGLQVLAYFYPPYTLVNIPMHDVRVPAFWAFKFLHHLLPKPLAFSLYLARQKCISGEFEDLKPSEKILLKKRI
ncbi:MAG: hypothetical protein L5656_09660 [Thermanaeromonas sp.]|uniref:hypothetical protein n=1 Tax=Thermanaeromonas sp. TaxID=2003697 RepID=UPI00243D8565|nr:hypothetical protein [Thermanaeromonas sp.]MCG0278778.1 hypothetical protein [Thermanaeromonas sp.]